MQNNILSNNYYVFILWVEVLFQNVLFQGIHQFSFFVLMAV